MVVAPGRPPHRCPSPGSEPIPALPFSHLAFAYLYHTRHLPVVAPVNRLLAFFLVALLLFQTLGQEVLVVDYQLNKARITALYCVNKARPQLHCNGKCHLAQQLRRAESGDKKAPTSALAKIKYEVLPTTVFALRPPRRWLRPARRYPIPPAAYYAAVPGPDVFRPPLPLA